jgi:hypothetical protein
VSQRTWAASAALDVPVVVRARRARGGRGRVVSRRLDSAHCLLSRRLVLLLLATVPFVPSWFSGCGQVTRGRGVGSDSDSGSEDDDEDAAPLSVVVDDDGDAAASRDGQ